MMKIRARIQAQHHPVKLISAVRRSGHFLFKLALPAIAAQIINVLYNMVDRMYIGHIPDIGPSALTGVGVTMPIIMCISAFAALAAMGGAPQASILMGKGDKDSAEKVLGNCTFMLTVISLVLTALFLWALGADPPDVRRQ